MKKLMIVAIALGLLTACGNSKNTKDMLLASQMPCDSVVEIIGEWVVVPMGGTADDTAPRKVKFNRDYTMDATPVMKTERKKKAKSKQDTVVVTTMVYQVWDQEGDTLTMISQSAVDPQMQDTVSWGIVELTKDSLKLNNTSHGAKHYVRHK